MVSTSSVPKDKVNFSTIGWLDLSSSVQCDAGRSPLAAKSTAIDSDRRRGGLLRGMVDFYSRSRLSAAGEMQGFLSEPQLS